MVNITCRNFSFFITLLVLLCCGSLYSQDQFIGEIKIVPYNFAPRDWADCNGQILSIAQNTALFSLLGTQYGGNGTTNFALPNLNDRLAVGWGQGPGLSSYDIGQTGGSDAITLLTNQLPSHTHPDSSFADNTNGSSSIPTNAYPAKNKAGVPQYSPSANGWMMQTNSGSTGGGQPHNNRMPYLGLKFVIALQGIYPQRP